MMDEEDDGKEWPNMEKAPQLKKYTHTHTRNNPMAIPLFIRECGRFIPAKNEKTGYVDWHPFNMPEYTVRRVELTGTITLIRTNVKYIVFELNDGTGAITVLYRLSKYQADLEYRKTLDGKYAASQEGAPKFAPLLKLNIKAEDFNNPSVRRIKHFQRKNSKWWSYSRMAMAGKELEIGDYVDVTGFCGLRQDALTKKGEKLSEECLWKHYELPQMIFNAFMVRAITEKQYNLKVSKKYYNDVAKKYAQK